MSNYDNANSGVLFPNGRKRQGKRDPDWTGTWTDAHGVEYWLSAWETGGLKPRLNVRLGNRKEPRHHTGTPPPAQQPMAYGSPPPASPRGQQIVTCIDPRDGSHFQATFADAQANGWSIAQVGNGQPF